MTQLSRNIMLHASRALGGAPRLLTTEQIEKMSPEAQVQLLDVLQKLERKADNPSPSQVMRLMARGGFR